jgi:hypothetical protein
MQTIIVERVIHRDEARLLLKFEKAQTLIEMVRSIADCRWSKTHGAWHVPDSSESRAVLVKLTAKGVSIRWGDQKPVAEKVITK